jgi:ferredoxin
MTYVITEACIGEKDLSCIDVCPADCIHEADQMAVIDPYECIDCAACEPVCPVQAIVPADGVRADQREFLAINSAWTDGAETVDRLIGEWRAVHD